MTNPRLLSIVAGAGVFAAVLGGGFAYAATSSGSSAPADAILAQTDDHQAERDAYLEKLAANLGISVDTLKEALKTTSLQTLDEKVAAGEITSEQADAIRERIEAGDTFFGIGPKFGAGPGFGERHIVMGAATGEELATFLGIDQQALIDALESGQTLAQVAEANGKSRDELKSFLSGELDKKLDEAVAAGDITQAQADEKQAAYDEHLDEMIDNTMPPHPRMFRGEAPAPGDESGSDSGAIFRTAVSAFGVY